MSKTDQKLLNALRARMNPETTVLIGLGNPDRADDGIGILVPQRLKEKFPDHIFSERERGVEALTLEFSENVAVDSVLYLDASRFGGRPGDMHLFGMEDADKIQPALSTHKVPLPMLMALLNRAGKQPFFLGVEPATLTFMEGMSTEVAHTAEVLVVTIEAFFASDS
jgi:hydrogenase maturation protease